MRRSSRSPLRHICWSRPAEGPEPATDDLLVARPHPSTQKKLHYMKYPLPNSWGHKLSLRCRDVESRDERSGKGLQSIEGRKMSLTRKSHPTSFHRFLLSYVLALQVRVTTKLKRCKILKRVSVNEDPDQRQKINQHLSHETLIQMSLNQPP